MSGGDDWGNFYQSLLLLPEGYKVLFILFMLFAVIAILNVVTAVFVESTMQRSRSDRELMTQNELTAKREFLETMQGVFNELDEDGDNEVDLKELANKLKKP